MTGPKGKLTLQTLAMPSDTNANGDIFGGWIVSQMDLSAGILAKEISQGRVATVAINSMVFHKPVHVGDVVSCYGEIEKIGTSSITMKIEVWCNSHAIEKQEKVTEGIFVYVAINEQGRPRPVRN